jgi:hypothetical protein
VIVTFDTSRWAHVCDTSVALGAPQRRAVEQVRTDHGLGIIHDLCVMRCLTVLFGQNYVTVTHWPLRGPVRTARQLVVQRTTDMVANAAVRTDSTRTLMFVGAALNFCRIGQHVNKRTPRGLPGSSGR